MKVRVLNEAASYVRQFAGSTSNTGSLFDGYRRVRINAGDGSVRLECGTFDQGGNVTMDAEGCFEGFNEIEINIHELSDYLRALPADGDMSTKIDGGFFVVKCGRATKKFEIHFQKETFRQAPMRSEWIPLYYGFSDDVRLLNRLNVSGDVTLVSADGYLYYKDGLLLNLLLVLSPGLPTFQVMKKFVPKILSCNPTHIAVDPNRVGFKNDSMQMFVPLTTSKIPMVSKALETILPRISPDPITLSAAELKGACKIMATEWDETRTLFIFLTGTETGVSMSCGRGGKTSCVIDGHIPQGMDIGLNYIAAKNIVDIGFGDPVSIGVTSTSDAVCLRRDNLIYLSSLRRNTS